MASNVIPFPGTHGKRTLNTSNDNPSDPPPFDPTGAALLDAWREMIEFRNFALACRGGQ